MCLLICIQSLPIKATTKTRLRAMYTNTHAQTEDLIQFGYSPNWFKLARFGLEFRVWLNQMHTSSFNSHRIYTLLVFILPFSCLICNKAVVAAVTVPCERPSRNKSEQARPVLPMELGHWTVLVHLIFLVTSRSTRNNRSHLFYSLINK